MALINAERVRETSITTGTGDLSLAGAADSSYQTISAVAADLDTGWFMIRLGSAWERSYCRFNSGAGTLSRLVVVESTNSGALVNFGAGTKDIILDFPAKLASVISGRNKIINGAMEIDQRNAGALVTGISGYALDRWACYVSGGGAINTQQVDASTATIGVTMPAGFKNAMYLKCTTADASIVAGDYYVVQQSIEGSNCTDLDFGLSTAKTITFSFWVRSSVTGTYGGSFINSSNNRTYPFQYTISSANTFEKKTITIAGDTTGTWLTTTAAGLTVEFDLGSGSTFQGTVNTWAAAYYLTATGSTQWIATVNATFYLTGVQLEAGSVATPFERRQYGQELALCQRYYQVLNSGASSQLSGSFGTLESATTGAHLCRLIVSMRVAPAFPTLSGTYYIPGITNSSAGTAINQTTSTDALAWETTGMSSGSIGAPIWYNGAIKVSAEL